MENNTQTPQEDQPKPTADIDPDSSLQSSPTPAIVAEQTAVSGGQSIQVVNKRESRRNMLLIGALVSVFLFPALGLLAAPMIVYLAVTGVFAGHANRKAGIPLTKAQIIFRIIGWVAITIAVLIVGLFTLLFIAFSSGDFKIG